MKKLTLLILFLWACVAQGKEVILVWNANAPEEQVTHYIVYELTGAGWAKIGESESPRFVVGEREPGRYEWAVTAVNFWGESVRSDSATTPGVAPARPGVPQLEGAKRVAMEVSEDLETWQAVAVFNSLANREFWRVKLEE